MLHTVYRAAYLTGVMCFALLSLVRCNKLIIKRFIYDMHIQKGAFMLSHKLRVAQYVRSRVLTHDRIEAAGSEVAVRDILRDLGTSYGALGARMSTGGGAISPNWSAWHRRRVICAPLHMAYTLVFPNILWEITLGVASLEGVLHRRRVFRR